MVDLFEEVEEQLRSERYLTLVRRLAPWVTGVFAAVLIGYLGYWGFKLYQDRNLATAAAEYQKGVDALGDNDSALAAAHFQAAAKSEAPAYRSLALMQQAGLKLAAGKNDEAAALYDAAAKAAPNPIFRDMAQLKAAWALLDHRPYAQLATRLQPLAAASRPYAPYAKQALAMAKVMAGKTAEARSDFSALSISLGTPDEVRQQAQIAMALIDAGEAPTAVAAVKAAALLPPSPQLNLAPPPEADDQGGAPQSSAGAAQ